MTVRVLLKAGSQMSYHCHEHRNEVWTIVAGTGKVILDGNERIITAGDVVSILNGQKHTIVAETETILIEVQMGKEISVHDKIKYSISDN